MKNMGLGMGMTMVVGDALTSVCSSDLQSFHRSQEYPVSRNKIRDTICVREMLGEPHFKNTICVI